MRTALFLVLAVVIPALACSGDATDTPLPATPTTESAASACAAAGMTEARITSGLNVPGVTLTDAVSVAAMEPPGYVFVAGELDGENWELPGDTGVWVTNDLEAGDIYSVNGVAREFSTFGVASDVDPLLGDANAAASQAEFCSEHG